MRIAGIVRDSIVNGPGIRDVVFFQGCKQSCEGCHNPDTWNPHGGYEVTVDSVAEELSTSSNDVTISGGEPLLQFFDLFKLCRLLKAQGKNVWVYTGYTLNKQQIVTNDRYDNIDVVVDGCFKKGLRDPSLLFRGSSNQRIIDIQKTRETGEFVLWEDEACVN